MKMQKNDSMRCATALRCLPVRARAMALARGAAHFFHSLRGVVFLALTLLLIGTQATAAELCIWKSGNYGEVAVTTEGACRVETKYAWGTYLTLGKFNSWEACTFNFSVPVKNLSVRTYTLNCSSDVGCEKMVVSVNGNHYPFTAAEVTTPAADPEAARIGGLVPVKIDADGNLGGATAGSGGSAWAFVSRTSVSSVTLSHEPLDGQPNGSDNKVCFFVSNLPVPPLALKKEASAAPWVVGQPASYTLTLTNSSGTATTSEMVVTDNVPSSLTIGDLPPWCSRIGQNVGCLVPPGLTSSVSFVIPVTPLPSAVPSVTNTATVSRGGDAMCNDMGACTSTVTTPVVPTPPPVITSTKTVSASPLVVGAPNQFYAVLVTVANGTTTAPISVMDTLPPGVTLRGAPTLVAGTTNGVLSGCPTSGSNTTNCSVAAGIAPGTFEIRIPVNVAASAVGATGGTNMVNLSGGGDVACTTASAEACDASTPATRVVPQATLKLEKIADVAQFAVAAQASYTLKLSSTNGGMTTANSVITDTIPASLAIGALPAGCSRAGQAVTCTVPAGMATSASFVIPVTPLATARPSVTNVATAVGGGDPACNGAGACVSAATTPVAPAPHIMALKYASTNSLIVGMPGQFYEVDVWVENGPTTAPLVLEDVLPHGITLAGPPVLLAIGTTGVLSGCSAAGSAIVRCSVAAGVAPGLFQIRIPVHVDAAAVGPQGGTNTVNLSGGGDPACTATPNEAICDDTTPPVAVRLGDPKLRIAKDVISGSGTHRFDFALSGLSVARDTITVTVPGQGAGAQTITGKVGVPATITETSPAGWPVNPVSASCYDLKDLIAPSPIRGASGSRPAAAAAQAPPVVLAGNVLTIPAEWMVVGADIRCTFVNSDAHAITGRVFNDNGSGAGVPNDGVANGGEAGLAGVRMRLTNCGARVWSTAVTDGLGHYRLEVPSQPSSPSNGDPLCVEEVTPAGHLSTGASVGSTPLPSGTGVAVGGRTYTYTRTAAGAPDHIAFAWNEARAGELNFGDVALNRFGADSARTGSPGSSVSHAHTFVAQTGGTVSFGVAGAEATPPIDGWSARIFDDPGCTGALQAGAAVLYPPAVPRPVTTGQNLCVVVQEFIPAGALAGYNDKRSVQASFVFTNASPALSASYLVLDTTTVSSTALELKKEVRNLTKNGDFGLNNEAKSGETLEYRITYTNNGATPISGLTVSDVTPVYTSFAGSQEGTTPATLTACTKRTPANALPAPAVACAAAQAPGGTGPLDWKFTGQLAPGGTGSVRFRVTVN
ncbi:putative repeat protein (TIGR01451 family) [Variovorax boronicumulans]|uniref:prealbumin-like fold domain-containing protein n=1 Tax=Variovorax boronicumulans TaxID=436515 RepID=UPI0027801DB3|nr:hypothetical protein [Variovorax boronicumulans]MDP9919496.1 putative repeat protein (TIGR01451 family) [Variovorax boronicumulans]